MVVAAELGMSVGPFGRAIERHERELRDRLAGPEHDRHACEVRDLERERAREARVHEAGRGVDDQAEPAQAGVVRRDVASA